jgi:hypothetical protein
MRVLPLLICLGSCVVLAGCFGAGAENDVAPIAAPAAAPAPEGDGMTAHARADVAAPAAAEAPKSKRKGKSKDEAKSKDKSKDEAKSKDDGKDEWWKDGPVTREKVSAMCWMKYEKGRKDLPLEKRADLVNACVDEALKEHPVN